MRNDDPMYVKHLEYALEAAELEIKGLEGELREQDKILSQMQEQLAPTKMREPYITYAAAQLREAQVEVLREAADELVARGYYMSKRYQAELYRMADEIERSKT